MPKLTLFPPASPSGAPRYPNPTGTLNLVLPQVSLQWKRRNGRACAQRACHLLSISPLGTQGCFSFLTSLCSPRHLSFSYPE